MKKTITAATFALLAVAGLGWAQEPYTPPPTTPTPATPTATAREPATTLVGCLYREDQVPGRKPNVAERAGVLEDYILADATVAGAQAKPGAAPGATGTTGTTGTAGTTPASGNMYKVEGPSDEKLKALVGKRVEVMGSIDREGAPGTQPGGPKPDRGLGPDQINLPEFEVSSIREISGSCPATPAAPK
jgi:hypothetical protein